MDLIRIRVNECPLPQGHLPLPPASTDPLRQYTGEEARPRCVGRSGRLKDLSYPNSTILSFDNVAPRGHVTTN